MKALSGQLLLFVDTTPLAVLPPLPPTDAEIGEMFAEWYRHYPRHRAVAAARKAFHRVITKGEATIATLIEGADRYAEECRHRGTAPNFISHPATWINAQRWLDEYDPGVSAATASAARIGAEFRAARGIR